MEWRITISESCFDAGDESSCDNCIDRRGCRGYALKLSSLSYQTKTYGVDVVNISVAGKDVTDEVGGNLKTVAGMRDGAQSREAFNLGAEVIDLAGSGNEAEFAGRHLELLRHSCYVDNDRFSFSKGSAGGIGMLIRKLCWKILRPVFDWMSHKQNNINAQIVHAMELEKKERDRQVARLEKAIEELKNGRR